MARCSRSSSFLSAFHAACVALPFSGRGKKLLPFRANDPRLLPSILRRTVYFQYAACSATSQMLWRPGPGRQAASTIDTPLSDCFRFGPCQVFLSYASSSSASTSFGVFTRASPAHALFDKYCPSPNSPMHLLGALVHSFLVPTATT